MDSLTHTMFSSSCSLSENVSSCYPGRQNPHQLSNVISAFSLMVLQFSEFIHLVKLTEVDKHLGWLRPTVFGFTYTAERVVNCLKNILSIF